MRSIPARATVVAVGQNVKFYPTTQCKPALILTYVPICGCKGHTEITYGFEEKKLSGRLELLTSIYKYFAKRI